MEADPSMYNKIESALITIDHRIDELMGSIRVINNVITQIYGEMKRINAVIDGPTNVHVCAEIRNDLTRMGASIHDDIVHVRDDITRINIRDHYMIEDTNDNMRKVRDILRDMNAERLDILDI